MRWRGITGVSEETAETRFGSNSAVAVAPASLDVGGLAMLEPVRLVIWDLDETFWRGTLTEGGIEFVPGNKEVVIELARRGIVSTICSKNELIDVKTILTENEIWDYFVLPSVSWGPKGPRIQALIETIGLRPATAMFIDDNPLNLEEARRCCPDLQTRTPGFIKDMLGDPLFRGKDDRELTRLKQYKILEQRRADQQSAGADIDQFLRDSEIEVTFDYNIEENLDRFIELINRTNQLNFTKRRLPENQEEARAEARTIIDSYSTQAALIMVRDRYGDHGYCGVYVHDSEVRGLSHFAFSCRILGTGVERWVYQRLGRPRIRVEGEVLADLFDPTTVDWIRQGTADQDVQKAGNPHIERIIAHGSCDIGAIAHYFRLHSNDVVGEYHVFRNQGVFRIDHSVFLRHASVTLSTEQFDAAKRLGYVESDFQTRLYDPVVGDGMQLAILSFGAEVTQDLYTHKRTGLVLPVPFDISSDQRKKYGSIQLVPDSELPPSWPAWGRDAFRLVQEEWEHLGPIPPEEFKANLGLAVSRIPTGVQIRVINFFVRRYVSTTGVDWGEATGWMGYNEAIAQIADAHPNVKVVNLDDLVQDRVGAWDRLHFQRPTLFRIYQTICESLFAPNGKVADAERVSAPVSFEEGLSACSTLM